MSEPYRVIVSPEAAADVAALHDFIAQDSSTNATRMVERILAAIESLASFPHRSVLYDPQARLKFPVRWLTVRPYVIYFRVVDDQKSRTLLRNWTIS